MKQRIKNEESISRRDSAWWIGIISTTVLIVFMLLFLIMTTYSSNEMAAQTEIISDHPFEVVISAGELKAHITEMRAHMERLMAHNMPEDVERVRKAVTALYEDLDQKVDQLELLYLGDVEDVLRLRETLEDLKKEQHECLDFSALDTSTLKIIEQYEQDHLFPLYDTAIAETDKIITSAQQKKVHYGEMSNRLRVKTLIGSFILIGLMIVGVLVWQYVLYKQRRELSSRAALFDNLSENIDDAFIIWDADTKKVSYTALNMERVLGRSFGANKNAFEGFQPEDVEELHGVIMGHERDFKSPCTRVLAYNRPDGEKRFITLRIYRTQNLKSTLLIALFTDSTDDIRSRQALQDAMKNAEKANLAKSEFLSRMSHEIRTPLNAIIGMTTIAAASVNDPVKVTDCLTKVNFSSKHLLMLINDVLDMSKIESNKMRLQNESFDLFQAVSGFVSTIYPQAKAKGVHLQSELENFGEQMRYMGDPLRLNQILLNLASNAIKFTPAGGTVSLRVSKIASRTGTDTVRFVVADTGIGMTKEELDKIYTPFEQANTSIAGRFGGTGLGVSITKNLVTLMSGRIDIKSESGKGTCCTVELPLLRDEVLAPVLDFANEGLRALVVDDEQQVCEQTAALLENIKIQAQWVLTGEAAIETVSQNHQLGNPFDFCLIDWQLPYMDGIEITRKIRAQVGWGLPIIMISAYDYTEIEEEARRAGVNAFLPKPLYRTAVYAAVKATLNQNDDGKEASADTEDALRGKRLLIAEDNELNREILVTLLEMEGIKSECAANGREAINRFLSAAPGHYDAVLMDVQMPVMGGHEAAKKIRASVHPDARKIPIIATTANAFSEDISAALAAGMDAHVSKPIDMQQLRQVLSGVLFKNREEVKPASGR